MSSTAVRSSFSPGKLASALVAVQAAIGLYQQTVFFEELFRFDSFLGRRGLPGAGSSLVLLLALAAVSALWAAAARGASERPFARFAVAGLTHLALLGLVAFGVGLAGLPLRTSIAYLVLGTSAAGSFVVRAIGSGAPSPSPGAPAQTAVRLGAWDVLSAVFLLALLVPAVFPYAFFDARAIWGCRALAIADVGSLSGIAGCPQPGYPPLFSLLLWYGSDDPVFGGRLLPWAALVLFALFARARFARVLPSAAAPALLFVLSTVHVWQGTGMYYANAALMVFLSAGCLLVLGLPARGSAWSPPAVGELVSGTLCLSAAVLTRPDGLYYAAVVAGAAAWMRLRGRTPFPLAPFAVAALAAATWAVRPTALRGSGDFLLKATQDWRTVAPTLPSAFAKTMLEFLDGWQGQWLSHKGLGVAIYLLVGIAIWGASRRGSGGRATTAVSQTRFLGLVTLLFLGSVAFCYAVIPFASDPVGAVQPFEGDYLACYRNFVRVGIGRMTIHLYPFLVLYALGTIRDAGSTGGPS